MTRYLFLSDSYVLVSVGRPLWREDGSVFCTCRWSLPAQAFSGPSPLGLATVFYCLRFETSLFVASYDSQGHGGGIRPRLHTGYCLGRSSFLQDNPSARTTEKTHLHILLRGRLFTATFLGNGRSGRVCDVIYGNVEVTWYFPTPGAIWRHRGTSPSISLSSDGLTCHIIHTYPIIRHSVRRATGTIFK
jgi:hypothetical protein